MARNKKLEVILGESGIVIQPGYDGDRHYDDWVRHDAPGNVEVYTYPDGQLIRVFIPSDCDSAHMEIWRGFGIGDKA